MWTVPRSCKAEAAEDNLGSRHFIFLTWYAKVDSLELVLLAPGSPFPVLQVMTATSEGSSEETACLALKL